MSTARPEIAEATRACTLLSPTYHPANWSKWSSRRSAVRVTRRQTLEQHHPTPDAEYVRAAWRTTKTVSQEEENMAVQRKCVAEVTESEIIEVVHFTPARLPATNVGSPELQPDVT